MTQVGFPYIIYFVRKTYSIYSNLRRSFEYTGVGPQQRNLIAIPG